MTRYSTDEGMTWRKLQHTIGQCGFSAVEMLGISNAVVAASDAIYLLDVSEAPNGRTAHPSQSVPAWEIQ